jgi:hypothetical protein
MAIVAVTILTRPNPILSFGFIKLIQKLCGIKKPPERGRNWELTYV